MGEAGGALEGAKPAHQAVIGRGGGAIPRPAGKCERAGVIEGEEAGAEASTGIDDHLAAVGDRETVQVAINFDPAKIKDGVGDSAGLIAQGSPGDKGAAGEDATGDLNPARVLIRTADELPVAKVDRAA